MRARRRALRREEDGQNPTTNARDGIFSDGVSSELVSLAGDPGSGYSGTFQVGIAL
jgi:hypothetical protein